MALTDKQERFCLEYVIDYNATQAAIRSGYSEESARQQASRLLTKDDIKARVIELSNATADELGITRRRILTKLWDVVEKSYEGAPKTDKDGDPIIVAGEMIMDWSPPGTTRALELLMKHRGDLIEKVHHEGGIDINVNGVDLDSLK